MAEQVTIVINVDDLGSAVLQKFSATARQSFDSLQSKSKQAFEQANSNINSFISTIRRAIEVSATFTVVNRVIGLLTDAVTSVISSTLDFDLALRQIASISETARSNLDSLRASIINTSPEFGTTTQVAQGLYAVLQSGLIVNDNLNSSLKLTEQAAKLATAGLTSNAVAAKILTQSLNAYGQTADQAGRFSDILFKAVELGQFSFEELASQIGPVLPIARALGVSFADVNAALAVLSQAGFSAAEGATALRGSLINTINEAAKFRAVGINVSAVIGQQGLYGFFRRLADVTGLNQEKLKALIPDTRAVSAVLSILSQDADKVSKVFGDVNSAAGVVDVAFQQIRLSARQSISELIASLDRLGQTASGPLLIPLISSLKAAVTVIDFLTELTQRASAGLLVLGAAFTTAFGGVQVLLGLVAEFFSGFAKDILYVVSLIPGLKTIGKSLYDIANNAYNSSLALEEAGVKNLKAFNDLGGAVQVYIKEVATLIPGNEKAAGSQKELASGAEQVRQGLAKAANEVLNYSGGVGKAGAASASAVGGTKAYDEALTFLSNRAAAGATNFDEITNTFNRTSQSAFGLSGQIQTVIQPLIDIGTQSRELSQKHFANLLGIFATAITDTTNLRLRLAELGATEEILGAKTSELDVSFIKQAANLGVNKDELALLVEEYRESETAVGTLSARLKAAGVDVANVITRIAGLTAAQREGRDATLSLDNALKTVTGTSLAQLNAQALLTAKSVRTLIAEGKVPREELIGPIEALTSTYIRLGLTAPKVLAEIRAEVFQLIPTASEVQKAFAGITFEQYGKNVSIAVGQARQALLSGAVDAELVKNRLQELIDQGIKIGATVPPELLKLRDSAAQIANAIGPVEKSFERLGITAPDNARKIAATLESDLRKALNDRNADIDVLAEKFRSGSKDAVDSLGKIPPGLNDIGREIDVLSGTKIPTFDQALQKFGTQTSEQVLNRLMGLTKAFNVLAESGRLSITQLNELAKSLVEEYRKAGVEVPKELLKAFENLEKKGKETSEALEKTLGEKAKGLGLQLGEDVSKGAERAINSVKELIASGEKNFVQLAGVVKNQIDNIIASGREVPPEYQELFNELVSQAEAAGRDIGSLLGKGFSDAADTARSEFDKLTDQLNKLDIGTRFRSDIPGILDQIASFQRDLQKAGSFDPLGNRQTTLKAIEQLKDRLLDAFQSAVSEAKQLAETTGQIILPAQLEAAAQVLGINFAKIRQELEQIIKSAGTATTEPPARTPSSGTGITTFRPPGDKATTEAPVINPGVTRTDISTVAQNAFMEAISGFKDTTDRLKENVEINQKVLAGEIVAAIPDPRRGPVRPPDRTQDNERKFRIGLQDFVGREVRFPVRASVMEFTSGLDSVVETLDDASSTIEEVVTEFDKTADALKDTQIDLTELRTSESPEAVKTIADLEGGKSQGITIGGSGGNFLPKFANGTLFASPGQNVQLESGEAVLPRKSAEILRANLESNIAGNLRFNVGYNLLGLNAVPTGTGHYGPPAEFSGFQFVPGYGFVPSFKLAAATGRLNDQLGGNAQRDLQRTIVPLIRGSITRRDLTRPLTAATSLTRKGTPRLGGS